ncbi:MAG: hypothetical protein N3A65_01640 [candidate division WOR-3 bacterium]|nr:hypothetical protein [candidate division WOR-3 bacterium]
MNPCLIMTRVEFLKKMYTTSGIGGLCLGSIPGYRIVERNDYNESEASIITIGCNSGALASTDWFYC